MPYGQSPDGGLWFRVAFDRDQIKQQLANPSIAGLCEALGMLEKAIARVPVTKPDFFWPEFNHALCNALMEEFGVK